MYRYDEFDALLVRERADQFRSQVARRLAGELTEDEFKPLRLMNGLYLQLHSYMLRIAIPYGTLSARQLRKLGHIARKYDRGYGHFTTRQNLQLHWSQLPQVPDMLLELAEVEMHCLQTSGNCVRNITADHFAGAADDEIEDPLSHDEDVALPDGRHLARLLDRRAAEGELVQAVRLPDVHHDGDPGIPVIDQPARLVDCNR